MSGRRGGPAPGPGAGRVDAGHRERGSGTILAASLGIVVMLMTAGVLLLAQAGVMASRAASAADLAALAGADAARGIMQGDPCSVAASVAARHSAAVLSCTVAGGEIVEVRTELAQHSPFGAATGRARAGPPP
ncbi:Rv3654c family TadE-like protein [Arthrobacter cavernae]|uniref:Flp pilus-assembly TadE/G-like family protein n=1 Tax=Arthrobacter cavernae TaxID=2817681 RepID=A0A939HB26_9MICC|nr:Rv3654c family TadE-like protein [Arthrobacter cavernae]MBO1267617.1 flp pilus-assembly TadE/G-like family protein [Arthrobacter cavernae]